MNVTKTTGIETLDRLTKAMGIDVPKRTPKKGTCPLSNEDWKAKYVYPLEHARRSRPKRKYEHIISLQDAIEEIGQALCEEEWQGTPENPYEWYARSSNEIKTWNEYTDQEKIEQCTYRVVIKGVYFQNDEEEIRAYERRQHVYTKMIMWLNQGSLDAFSLSEDGRKHEIPCQIWIKHQDNYGNYAHDVFKCGRISGRAKPGLLGRISPDGDEHDSEIVYLCNEQLQNILIEIKPHKAEKDFSAPASLNEHINAYNEHHEEQIKRFFAGEVDKPWKGHTQEEPAIKAIMLKRFNRDKYRKARVSVLAKYSKVVDPQKTRLSSTDYARLKNFLIENQ